MREQAHLIWDWNGTLLDDVFANMHTVDEMLAARGLEIIGDREKYRRLFGFPISEFYRSVGFDLDGECFDTVAREYVARYEINARDARLYDDALQTLDAFRLAGVKMSLLSASEHTRLQAHAALYGVDGYFSHIMGVADNLGSSKAEIGARFVKTLGDVRAVFIGDTEHDAAVARCCNADCVLVARGHTDSERLEKTGCAVFADLASVFEYIKDKYGFDQISE